jgi:zinc protease
MTGAVQHTRNLDVSQFRTARPTNRHLTCALVIFLAGMTCLTQAAEPKKTASIEGITEYRLDNGLQVLLYPDASSPKVTVNLTVFVGSRHEGYGEAGMAHLLEHMLFKGTPTHQKIPKLLQERGANFNGTTSLDRTNYYETLNATDDNLEFALKLEADRMMNSNIRGEDLQSEMTVVRNEFERGENSPSRILMQRMRGLAFEWHNYGKSTIGNRSDIERVPIPSLRSFYRKYYQPDNAMVVIAGKFDTAKALQYVQKYFGSIPSPDRKLPTTYTIEPAQDGERSVTLRRVGDINLVAVSYHIPAGPHPDFAAVDALGYILAIEPAGRLYKAMIETRKVTAMYGGSSPQHDPGLLTMLVEVPKKGAPLKEIRELLISEVEKIGEQGVTEEEVNRVKRQILQKRERSLTNSTRIALDLSNWAAQGDWRLFFLYRDRIEKVTATDVKRVAASYLRPSNRIVGTFIPAEKADRVEIPSTPDPKSLVENYQGRKTIAAGEVFDPSLQNIEKRTERGVLIDGIKMALLPKKSRGEQVRLSLTIRYGDADSLNGLQGACQLLPTLMMRGTKSLSHEEFTDKLDEHQTVMTASGGLGSVTFSLQTKRQEIPAAIELLQQVLRAPALPAEQFEILRRERAAALEGRQTDPQTVARQTLQRKLFPYPENDVRHILPIAGVIERYKKAKLDDVKRVYNDFLGTGTGELTIVGDFDPDQTLPLLKQSLQAWKAEYGYSRIPDQAFDKVPGSSQVIQIPDKANAVYYAGNVISMSQQHADYPALKLGIYILGGGSLSSRLGDRIRQKEGLSYGVGAGFSGNWFDNMSKLTIGAISNPQNSPKVVKSIGEEVDLLVAKGISEEELQQAKKGYLQSLAVQRTSDGNILGLLATSSYEKTTMADQEQYETAIRELSAKQVGQALKKHINLKRLIIVTAGDFSAVKKSDPGTPKKE